MTNFTNIESVKYLGKEANEIMSKPLFESDLYSYGLTYMPDVKGKRQIVTGEVGELFQTYSCAFSPNSTVKLAEQFIEPVVVKVNLEQCYDAFWSSFLAEQTRRAYVGESNVPQTFFDWFMGDVLIKNMKKQYEDMFWNGDKSSTGDTEYIKVIDGVVKQVNEASGSTKITGAVLTSDNILDQIKAVVEKISMDVDPSDYKIFLNKGQMRLLLTALGNKNVTNDLVFSNFAKEGNKVYAYGFEVVPCQIAKDVILAAPAKNLVLGFDVQSDATEFQLLDMSQVTGDNSFRVIAMTSLAVGIVFPELMVLSKPAA